MNKLEIQHGFNMSFTHVEFAGKNVMNATLQIQPEPLPAERLYGPRFEHESCGIGFAVLTEEMERRHRIGYPAGGAARAAQSGGLPVA